MCKTFLYILLKQLPKYAPPIYSQLLSGPKPLSNIADRNSRTCIKIGKRGLQSRNEYSDAKCIGLKALQIQANILRNHSCLTLDQAQEICLPLTEKATYFHILLCNFHASSSNFSFKCGTISSEQKDNYRIYIALKLW